MNATQGSSSLAEFAQETRRIRKGKRAKNPYIQDEADDDDMDEDDSGELVEEEYVRDIEDGQDYDSAFDTMVSRTRQYQTAQSPSENPAVFAELIHRVEASVIQKSASVNISKFWNSASDLLQDAFRETGSPGFVNKYIIYHIRCRRGKESGIIRRIQADIDSLLRRQEAAQIEADALLENGSPPTPELTQLLSETRIVEDVYPSRIRGYIYLVVLNVPDNSSLKAYLHSFADFVYSKSMLNRKEDIMPVHQVVHNTSPKAHTAPKFSVGDWVQMTGQDLYGGCYGLIVAGDERLEHPPGIQWHTVLTIPRVPRSPDEEASVLDTQFKPLPLPLSWDDAQRISTLYELDEKDHWGDAGTPEWGLNFETRCGMSCPEDHRTEFFFHGEIFQCGLVLVAYNEKQLKPAPVVLDSKSLGVFTSSHHQQVLRHARTMPVPDSWIFLVGEAVEVLPDFIPDHVLRATGRIVSVSESACLVHVKDEPSMLIPNEHIMKSLKDSLGDVNQSFQVDEEVLISENYYRQPIHGIIRVVQDFTCDVDLENGGLRQILKYGLVKNFKGGEEVLCNNEARGSLICSSGKIALVALYQPGSTASEASQTFPQSGSDANAPARMENYHPNCLVADSSSGAANLQCYARNQPFTASRTRPSLWIGLDVIVTRHAVRHGYKGVVTDVACNSTSASGMIVLVNYDVINVQPGVEWLEYDQVRNAKTLRYLHDASRSGLDFYYHFKDGYFPPAYTAYEKQIMKRYDELQEGSRDEAVVTKQEAEVHKLISHPLPPPELWVLDPRWHLGLRGLEFYIIIHHGVHAKSSDQRVYLELFDRRLVVRMRVGKTNKRESKVVSPSDICNVPPGKGRTRKVNERGYDARGLYLVAFSGEQGAHHIGKLVRRITIIRDDEKGYLGEWLVQRVLVKPVGTRVGHEECLMEDEPFRVHYSMLLSVHMSPALMEKGNALMLDVRLLYSGIVTDSDYPKGSKESLHCTPPGTPHPEIKDWDKIGNWDDLTHANLPNASSQYP